MTQEELRSLIPLNKRGVPRSVRLREIDRLLTGYKYDPIELVFFETEINLLANNRRKKRHA